MAAVTIRELLDGLIELAATLPDGDNSPIELAICDGDNLQIIDDVDVDVFTLTSVAGQPELVFALIRGHMHPGTSPGRVIRRVGAAIEDDLRELTEGENGTT